MDMSWIVPVGIVGAVMARGAFTTWVGAKHGYPLEEERHRRRYRGFSHRNDGVDDGRKVELLSSENERLNGQVSRLEERIAVLERIATDPAERTAREIEALRGQ